MREARTTLRRQCLGALVVATISPLCLAGLTTIHEGGPTVPIGQLMSVFNPKPVGSAAATSTTLPISFPIITASMRPGHLLQPLRLRTAGWLTAPMFMIGDDPLSRRWLAANRERLLRAGAAGLAVNVPNLDAFQALRALAPDIPMAVGSVEGLVRHSGLTTYPLFVSADGIASQEVP
ncbi:MAG TPA: integrating conjugative element protein [Burkholderiaceae bacterium]|nr:integrating conjugative element protein [Burkholderiaceae bacterium]